MDMPWRYAMLLIALVTPLSQAASGQEAFRSSILPTVSYAQNLPYEQESKAKESAKDDKSEKDENEDEEDDEEEEEPLETERDAFTPRTKTLSAGAWVTEFSHSFVDLKRGPNKQSYPELLSRYAVSDWLELRLGWNHETSTGEISSSGTFVGGGAYTALYGGKLYMTRQNFLIPESSLIIQGYTPTGGKRNDSKFLPGWVFGWRLPSGCKLDAALRMLTDSEKDDHFITWLPSVVLRIPVGPYTWTHCEYFALVSQQKAEEFNRQFLSCGFSWNPTLRVELGFRFGVGLNQQSANYFTNVGAGVRF